VSDLLGAFDLGPEALGITGKEPNSSCPFPGIIGENFFPDFDLECFCLPANPLSFKG